MLWLVGMGIHGLQGITLQTIDILKSADVIFLETYTSPISDNIDDIKNLIEKDIRIVQRWFVEDGREILNLASNSNVVLLVYGDPLIATTHTDLRIRAASKGIESRVIHGSSIVTSVIGECGLHVYKFGRVVTMVTEKATAPSVYKQIHSNLLAGSHTLILLEYNQEKNFFLDPRDALLTLLECEEKIKHQVLSGETFAIIASRIGDDNQIVAGSIDKLLREEYGAPPHSIIITGNLHFTEEEALRSFCTLLNEPRDNSRAITSVAEQMLLKYVPKARRALAKAKDLSFEFNVTDLLDNAERYIDDSERFLNQGEHELAILSIGYAEGLVDALGFIKGIDLWE